MWFLSSPGRDSWHQTAVFVWPRWGQHYFLCSLIAEIAFQLQAPEGHDPQRQQEIMGLCCRRKGDEKSRSRRTKGHGGWLDHEVLAHQREAMLLYIQTGKGSSTPHQLTPKIDNYLSCLAEKEKSILELILINRFADLYFFVSIALKNSTTFLQGCRPRVNHVWKTWHFSSNNKKMECRFLNFYFLLPPSSNEPLKSLRKIICNFPLNEEHSGFWYTRTLLWFSVSTINISNAPNKRKPF